MLRPVLSVVVGYLTKFALVVVAFCGLYAILGSEKSFEPGSWEPASLWVSIGLVIGLVTALIGGFVCAWIEGGAKAVIALAVVISLLDIVLALPKITAAGLAPETRDTMPTLMEAMEKARPAVWYLLAMPVVGTCGAIIGGRLRCARCAKKPA